MSTTPKPVTILTGFLGAGKTTFLNHLIEKNATTRYAIIENEFGEQGIDSELILRPDDTIVELNNGCLCCTLNDNLYDILNELFDRKDEFDEIILEATGVADPTGLAEPFVSHPLIKEFFPLRGIICLVDSEQVEQHIANTEEAIKQITFSDVLLLNKSDLTSKEHLEVLTEKMQRLNPLAQIVPGNKNNFPNIDLVKQNNQLEELFAKKHKLHEKEEKKETSFPVKKPHAHHHHEHTEEVNSQSFIFDQPFDYAALDRQFFAYLTLQARDLYRMKGLVWVEGSEEQYLIQSVGTRLDFEKKRAWETAEKKQSVLVFIGKNLQREALEQLLNNCLVQKTSI
ncbi:MAG TPA: GTP-binding protein [Microscillaceae bacterium]|nr:GTP-binding protein [Microscillaceae bacterium]